jgi:hypothetical protein
MSRLSLPLPSLLPQTFFGAAFLSCLYMAFGGLPQLAIVMMTKKCARTTWLVAS